MRSVNAMSDRFLIGFLALSCDRERSGSDLFMFNREADSLSVTLTANLGLDPRSVYIIVAWKESNLQRSSNETPGVTAGIKDGLKMKTESRSIGEIEISYVDAGKGPAVVLIHGHPFDATMWNPQVELLSKSYRVIVPELRGYGRSTMPPNINETRFDLFGSDILSLLDTLNVETFILGGLSMGGQVVFEIFRQAKQRVQALILADTFAGLDSEDVRQLRFVTADRIEKEGMNAYAEEILLKMITPENAKTFPQLAAHVSNMMRTTSPTGAAAALRGRAKRVDYLPLLDLISVPTLVVVGRQDSYTPVSVAQQLHERIRHSSLRIIEDAAHLPNLERSEQFNRVVLAFLRALDVEPIAQSAWHAS